jgi:SulP family sulfate permease
MLHALFLLGFMLVAAPLASFIPLAALAGILATVAWNMAEKHEFAVLLRASRGDALVLMATFLLTVFRDLTEGIIVGFALGALLFIHRMSEQVAIEAHGGLIDEDRADTPGSSARRMAHPDIVTYRLSGAFFFGAASTVGAVLDRIGGNHKAFVLDMAAVPFLDSTAAKTIAASAVTARKRGVLFIVAGASSGVRTTLGQHGASSPLVVHTGTAAEAEAYATGMMSGHG